VTKPLQPLQRLECEIKPPRSYSERQRQQEGGGGFFIEELGDIVVVCGKVVKSSISLRPCLSEVKDSRRDEVDFLLKSWEILLLCVVKSSISLRP
jgi:hypothetical protein